MPDYQKIAEIKIFVNSRSYLYCDFTEAERLDLGNKLKNLYEALINPYEIKNSLYVECAVAQNSDLYCTLTLFVKYIGLRFNTSAYPEILSFLYFVINEISNTSLCLNDSESFVITIYSKNIAPFSVAEKLFERAEAQILKVKNENKYSLYENEESLIKFFSNKLEDNFYFVNCHRNTGLHEVDIKLLEARYSIACGLSQAGISMLFIVVEESLKTLLKYKLAKELFETSKEKPSLDEVSNVSKHVQKEYGSKTLGPAIYLAHKENIIDDVEENRLKELARLRDGYIHSDKSKIFAKNKAPIHLIKINERKLQIVETKDMSINELIFGQGLAQKTLSDREAKRVFRDVEEMIFRICERFMANYKSIN